MHILVIDDEEMIRNLTQRILQKAGFEMLLAENGFDGIDLYKANQDSISLVIVDMHMDGLSGVETIQKINEISPDMRFIISSGNECSTVNLLPDIHSKVKFLMKPYRANDLTDTVTQLLEKVS